MSNIIVMAFSPRNIVGCFLKKAYKGGVTGTPGSPRRYALGISCFVFFFFCLFVFFLEKKKMKITHDCS